MHCPAIDSQYSCICAQDLVNLIICGKAISNVFDGDRQLDPQTNLKGIKKRCRVRLQAEQTTPSDA